MTTIQSSNIRKADDSHGTSRAGAPPSSLMPAATSTNPATMLAILQLECLSQSNAAAEKSQEAYDLAEAAADKARIDEMARKNTENMVLGVISSAGTVAAGALTIRAGFAEEQPGKKWEGAAKIADGGTKALDSVKSYNAGWKDIHIAEYEQQAKTMKRASERLDRAMGSTTQAESKVRELISEIVRGQDQCARSALFRA